jgi:hypothetical protein
MSIAGPEAGTLVCESISRPVDPANIIPSAEHCVTLTEDKQSHEARVKHLVSSFVAVCADNGSGHVAFGTSGKTLDTSQNSARGHRSQTGTLIVRVICSRFPARREQCAFILWPV